jgi:tetratricopeptide (TPR) repeat protein
MEEAMLPKIRIVPNLSKILVAGMVLGTIPWLVSGYLFTRAEARRTDVSSTAGNSADSNFCGSANSIPRLLPTDASVHRLQPPEKSGATVLISGYHAEGTAAANPPNDFNDGNGIAESGPVLNNPTSPTDSAPSGGSNADPSFHELPYPSTEEPAETWLPAEMPPAGASVYPSDTVSTPTAPQAQEPAGPAAAQVPPAIQPTTTYNPSAQIAALPARSEQLEAIARQADAETRQGFELASRGANYAARAKFIAALRLVAQGLDTDRQTSFHGKSLAAALTAIREAEDFLPRGTMLEANLDIPAIVASHTTPVLKNADNARTSSLSAMKSYLTYSQEQLSAAAGGEFSASMALRGLGKLHEEMAKNQNTGIQAAGAKAVVFYQAALLAAPQNYMAANDLGVMLARAGNLSDARAVLEHSAAVSRQSIVLHNLAKVYQRMGQNDLAIRTNQQSLLARRAEQANRQQSGAIAANGSVQWVDPGAFAQSSPNLASPPANAPAPRPQAKGVAQQAKPANPEKNAFGGNNPHWAPNYQR